MLKMKNILFLLDEPNFSHKMLSEYNLPPLSVYYGYN